MPKRVIDLSRDAKKQRITALSYGASRSGKTYFAATFPRPLFISDGKESGWETIRYMDPEAFYEKDRIPTVWAVDTAAQMMEAIQDAELEVRKNPEVFWTFVIDSLTFYVDGYLTQANLLAHEAVADKTKQPDTRRMYQDLAFHLKYMMSRLHDAVNVNILWLCLAKEPDMENKVPGGPSLVGQMAGKAPALCDHLFYHRFFKTGKDEVHQIHTRNYGAYIAGGRDGGRLDDPIVLTGSEELCGFRILENQLGLLPRSARAAQVSPQSAGVSVRRPAAVRRP